MSASTRQLSLFATLYADWGGRGGGAVRMLFFSIPTPYCGIPCPPPSPRHEEACALGLAAVTECEESIKLLEAQAAGAVEGE